MTIVSHAREADRITDDEAAVARRPLDFAPVEGEWVSTTGLGGGISRFGTRQHDGALLVGATGYGATRAGAVDLAP